MKVNAERLEGHKAKLTIELPAESFEKNLDKAFRQVVKQINIPGFRKGKAPRHIVERMYGREVFLEDAVNEAAPEAFRKALEDLGRAYECLVYPQYEVVSAEKGKGLVFTATYDLKPEVRLGVYKGLETEKPSEAIAEDAVDSQINAMRERFARLEKVEDQAVLGDICTIDFIGMVGDVPFEGGRGESYPLELGSNTFIPGFETQLVGARPGDEIKVNVTFPEDYHAAELAGKPVVFDVSVKGIQHKYLSDLDDEFAKDVSEFNTLEELKADIEEKLRKEAKDKSQAELEIKLVDQAIAASEIELTDSMTEHRQDLLVENFTRQLRRQGIEMEQYLQYTGAEMEQIRESFKDRAQKELRTELTLEAIADAEGMAVSDEDLDGEYQRIAQQTEKTADEIKDLYAGNMAMKDSLRFSLMMNKAVRFLSDNALIRETKDEPGADGADSIAGAEESGADGAEE